MLQINQSNEPIIVFQTITGFRDGSYAAEVYLKKAGDRKATLKVESSKHESTNYTTSSLWTNYIAANSNHGSKMQKIFVFFDVDKFSDNINLILNRS